MAIAEMNRFTLLTFHSHKQQLLKQLQIFGDVHLRTPDQQELEELAFLRSDLSHEQLSHYEAELEKAQFAAGKVAPYADKPGFTAKRPTLSFDAFDHFAESYDYEAVYKVIKEQDEALSTAKNDIARLESEIDALTAWRSLDVHPEALAQLETVESLLGTVNKQAAEEFGRKMQAEFPAVYVELLDTVREDTTLLMLFPKEQSEEIGAAARELGFTKATLQMRGKPEEIIRQNRQTIEELRLGQQAAKDAIAAQAGELQSLRTVADYYETILERERATGSFLASDTTLLIEGWVPKDQSAELQRILKNVCKDEFFLEEQPVERDSGEVPIKLRNNKFVRAFESVTSMYAMPRYNEIDPTPLLVPFYWLFFGFMVGDIGYGLLLLIGTTLALKLGDLKENMQSFMRFFRYLGLSTIVGGIFYGSFFGISVMNVVPDPAAEGGYRAILDTQHSIVTMLILSVAVGVVHILFGLSIKAYMGFRDKKPLDAFSDGILWILTLLSVLGWLLGGIGVVPVPVALCKWVFIACLVGLLLTQGRESPSLGGKIGNGLYGVYGLTSYVGDIVSYTRIVALALSGAYIAFAFNMMAGMILGDGTGGIALTVVRFIPAALVAIFGQALNFGLAMLGGYVHTCRLQYVEFFGKFYEGGGVPFRPLSLKYNHIQIKQ